MAGYECERQGQTAENKLTFAALPSQIFERKNMCKNDVFTKMVCLEGSPYRARDSPYHTRDCCFRAASLLPSRCLLLARPRPPRGAASLSAPSRPTTPPTPPAGGRRRQPGPRSTRQSPVTHPRAHAGSQHLAPAVDLRDHTAREASKEGEGRGGDPDLPVP